MAHHIVDHGVSGCFDTRLGPVALACGLRISVSPTSDNLTLQETLKSERGCNHHEIPSVPICAKVQNCFDLFRETYIRSKVCHPRMSRPLISFNVNLADSWDVGMEFRGVRRVPESFSYPDLKRMTAQLTSIAGSDRRNERFEAIIKSYVCL